MDSGLIQAWAAVVLIVITLLSLIGGGVWWMSALFSQVRELVEKLTATNTKVDESNNQIRKVRRTLARHQRGSNLFRNHTNGQLHEHDLRLINMETVLKPPPIIRDHRPSAPPKGLPPEAPGV